MLNNPLHFNRLRQQRAGQGSKLTAGRRVQFLAAVRTEF